MSVYVYIPPTITFFCTLSDKKFIKKYGVDEFFHQRAIILKNITIIISVYFRFIFGMKIAY